MSLVFIETKHGIPLNVDIQNAIDGFEYLNYEPRSFTRENLIVGKYDHLISSCPFIGSIDSMKSIFRRLNIKIEDIDFPSEVYINRILNKNTLDIVYGDWLKFPYFVKPVETKLFDGILIEKKSDLNYLRDFPKNTPIYFSAKLDILSEWRVFVHNKQMIYSANYKGDFRISPDYSYVEELINEYKSSPIAYAIDVAVLKDGKTTVIEFSDFWAIGSYGLDSIKYAMMLKDRYFEILGR